MYAYNTYILIFLFIVYLFDQGNNIYILHKREYYVERNVIDIE